MSLPSTRTLALVLLSCAGLACAGCGSQDRRPTLAPAAPGPSEASPGSAIPDPEACPAPDDGSQASLAVLAGRTLVSIDRGTAALDHALELARAQRDVRWVVCLGRALEVLRAQRSTIAACATRPVDGEAELAREIETMRGACETAGQVQREARDCGAE